MEGDEDGHKKMEVRKEMKVKKIDKRRWREKGMNTGKRKVLTI